MNIVNIVKIVEEVKRSVMVVFVVVVFVYFRINVLLLVSRLIGCDCCIKDKSGGI